MKRLLLEYVTPKAKKNKRISAQYFAIYNVGERECRSIQANPQSSSIKMISDSGTASTSPESRASSGPSMTTTPSSSNLLLLLGLGPSSNFRFLPEARSPFDTVVPLGFFGVGARSITPSASSTGSGRFVDVRWGVSGTGIGLNLRGGRGSGEGNMNGEASAG